MFPIVCSFPHLSRAKVVAVTDGKEIWEMRGSEVSRKEVGLAQLDILTAALEDSKRTLLQKQGIDASPFSIFAKVFLQSSDTAVPLPSTFAFWFLPCDF